MVNAKIAILAGLAVTLLAALSAGYGITLFSSKSGNFRVYLASKDNDDGGSGYIHRWALSHKNGVLKIQSFDIVANHSSIMQYSSSDGGRMYKFSKSPNDEDLSPSFAFTEACYENAGSSNVTSDSLATASLKLQSNGDYVYESISPHAVAPILTVKMLDGKPRNVIFEDGTVFYVESFEEDKEIDLFIPNSDLVCEDASTSASERRRKLATAIGKPTPNPDTQWMKLLFGCQQSDLYVSDYYSTTGFKHVKYISHSNAGGIFMTKGCSGNQCLWCGVAFIGTNDMQDVKNDVSISAEPCFGVNCHRGFHTHYKMLESQVRDLVGTYNCQKMHFMGHSLGGAVANIAAGYAVYSYAFGRSFDINNVRVSTAGAPRPFLTPNVAVTTANNHVRFVGDSDPFPALPPASWGFYHAQNSVSHVCKPKVCTGGRTWYLSCKGYSSVCRKELASNWGNNFLFNLFTTMDHLADKYMDIYADRPVVPNGYYNILNTWF